MFAQTGSRSVIEPRPSAVFDYVTRLPRVILKGIYHDWRYVLMVPENEKQLDQRFVKILVPRGAFGQSLRVVTSIP